MGPTLELALWSELAPTWPAAGRHVLAQYDATGVWLFQAYRPEIADEAVRHQRLGGPPGGEAASAWRSDRASWVKPGFLWMMHRASWATKKDQERILALYVSRASFDAALELAVPSSVGGSRAFVDAAHWRRELDRTDVVVQWDPDRSPTDQRLQRRAVQLGLRRGVLARVVQDELLAVHDITPLVRREAARRDTADVLVPRAAVYPVTSPEARARLGLDDP